MKKIVLPNGMRLILVPNQATSVVTALVMFGVGSRHETDEQAGISHVLEHMHYKGTVKRPNATKVAEFIESIGGEHNAFTGKEYTGYYVKAAKKHLPEVFDFLSDITHNSLFDEKELDREKGVILEEISMYEDLPMEMVGEKFEEALYGDNALGRDTIGFRETVKAINREALVKYRDSHYGAQNTVLALSGNFGDRSEEDLVALVKEYFNFKNRESAPKIDVKINQSQATKIVNKQTEQSHLVIGFHGVSMADPDRYALRLLATILGGSMSSRMFTEIREKRGLAYAVRTSSSNYSDSGSLETQVGVPHGKVEEVVKAVLEEYNKIKQTPVETAELAKAKEIIYGRLLISFEDSLDVAYHYATGEVTAGVLVMPEEMIKAYEKVTSDDILKAANKYLTGETMALAYIGPALTDDKLKPIFKL